MSTQPDDFETWTLAHAWHSDSDKAALEVCAAELAGIGIRFAGTSNAATANAVKMHGFEIVDALQAARLQLADLRSIAARQDWDTRVDPRALRFMRHGERMFGIPLNIHQSNCLWAHTPTAAATGASRGEASIDLDAWLGQAAKRIAKPLAIGNEPWQVGILFESLSLSVLGADAYDDAFVQLRADVLSGAAMVKVLDQLRRWRDLVDDDLIERPWREQLAAVNSGAAAVMVMGDWVNAKLPADVQRFHVDGFRSEAIFVVDFFVPVMRGRGDLAERVAAALTSTDFQNRFSSVKGSAPAAMDTAQRAAQSAARVDVPSLTFDQCCSVATKTRLLKIVADHFVHRRGSASTAEALAVAAGA